jgi:CHAT domain-containing protein
MRKNYFFFFLFGFLVLQPKYIVAQDIKTLQKYAQQAYQTGKLEQAIFWADKLLQKAKQDTKLSNNDYTFFLDYVAKLYVEAEQYEEAEKLYLETQEIRLTTLGNTHLDYATALDNLAMIYQANGLYNKAEPILLTAKEIREKNSSKFHPDYAQTLDNLAWVYEQLGLYEKAADFYWQAKEIREKTVGKRNIDYANTLHNLAELYAKQKNYTQAIKLYEDCLTLTYKLEGKNSIGYATTLDGLAAVYLQQKNYAEAKKMLTQSMEITANLYGNSHTDYALNLNTLADIFKSQKQYQQADSSYLQSLIIFEEKLGIQHHYYTNTLFNRAKLYEDKQDFTQAYQLYTEVLNRKKVEMLKVFPMLGENEKLIFLQNTKKFFTNFTNFAIKYAKIYPAILGQVFENQLLIKGLLVNNSKKIRTQILNSQQPNLIQQYNDLQKKRETLAQLFYTNTNKFRSVEIQQLSKTQYELEVEINQLEKQIATQFLPTITPKKEITWQNFVAMLPPNTMAIEILRQEQTTDSATQINYVALLITSKTVNEPAIKVLNHGDRLEKSALKFYQYALANQRTDTESYQLYWQPLQEMIDSLCDKKPEKIYLCADGVYHQLNINTLLNPETGQYLAEEQQICLLTNMKDIVPQISLATTNKKDTTEIKNITEINTNKLCVLVAGQSEDLPATKHEIAQIDTILQNSSFETKIYADSNATEENIKQIKNPYFLHFATHGFFHNFLHNFPTNSSNTNTNPLLRAGLLLNHAQKTTELRTAKKFEDNILTAYEVSNLALDSTQLVVLSACETGVGEIYDGEGIFGLQRAFFVAGAKVLLMSLWRVNDRATQILMTNFYTNLLQKQVSKQKALQMAQQTVREKYPHPYFWGAFVIVGE